MAHANGSDLEDLSEAESLEAPLRAWSKSVLAEFAEFEAICFGGSRIDPAAMRDGISDVDVYIFADIETPPDDYSASGRWPHFLGTSRAFRRRSFFSEQRVRLGEFDVDMKVMPLHRLYAYCEQTPSLDEIYLEKLHSILQYQFLARRSDRLPQLFDGIRQRQEAIAADLADIAFEAYTKLTYSAIKQGIFRSEALAAADCAEQAVHSLLTLAYLTERVIPPPFKWRSSPSRLTQLERGGQIADLLGDHRDGLGTDLRGALRVIRVLEGHISEGFTRPLWQGHRESPWWWWRGWTPETDAPGLSQSATAAVR